MFTTSSDQVTVAAGARRSTSGSVSVVVVVVAVVIVVVAILTKTKGGDWYKKHLRPQHRSATASVLVLLVRHTARATPTAAATVTTPTPGYYNRAMFTVLLAALCITSVHSSARFQALEMCTYTVVQVTVSSKLQLVRYIIC